MPLEVPRSLPSHVQRTHMHVCLWALGCLPQWSLLPRRAWWGDTIAIRIGTGDRDIGYMGTGDMGTGDMGTGDPATITTVGIAGK